MPTTLAKSNSSLHALRNLPPFPAVASRLMDLLRRQDSNFRDAVELMKTDASLTAEVLRLANSASAGTRFPVTSLLQALSTLGVNKIVSLTTTLCVGKLLRPIANLPVMRRCWRHNLATALIASQRSGTCDVDSETAYTFGLMAGIGRLAMLVSDPQLYSHLINRAERERMPVEILEMELYGFDHIEAGHWLVRNWKLPAEFDAVLFTAAPPQETASSHLASLIREATAEATRLGFGILDDAPADDVPLDATEFDIVARVNEIEQNLGI